MYANGYCAYCSNNCTPENAINNISTNNNAGILRYFFMIMIWWLLVNYLLNILVLKCIYLILTE